LDLFDLRLRMKPGLVGVVESRSQLVFVDKTPKTRLLRQAVPDREQMVPG